MLKTVAFPGTCGAWRSRLLTMTHDVLCANRLILSRLWLSSTEGVVAKGPPADNRWCTIMFCVRCWTWHAVLIRLSSTEDLNQCDDISLGVLRVHATRCEASQGVITQRYTAAAELALSA